MSIGPFPPSRVWGLFLAASGAIFSFTLACIVPFAAIATFAARGFSRRAAALVVLGAVASNQAVGFLCSGYPHDPLTYAWGVAIAAASLAALFAAGGVRGLASSAQRPASRARFAGEFVAAFAAYQGVIFAFSAVTHELGGFTPAILAQVAWTNVIGAGLLGIVKALVSAGRSGKLRPARADR